MVVAQDHNFDPNRAPAYALDPPLALGSPAPAAAELQPSTAEHQCHPRQYWPPPPAGHRPHPPPKPPAPAAPAPPAWPAAADRLTTTNSSVDHARDQEQQQQQQEEERKSAVSLNTILGPQEDDAWSDYDEDSDWFDDFGDSVTEDGQLEPEHQPHHHWDRGEPQPLLSPEDLRSLYWASWSALGSGLMELLLLGALVALALHWAGRELAWAAWSLLGLHLFAAGQALLWDWLSGQAPPPKLSSVTPPTGAVVASPALLGGGGGLRGLADRLLRAAREPPRAPPQAQPSATTAASVDADADEDAPTGQDDEDTLQHAHWEHEDAGGDAEATEATDWDAVISSGPDVSAAVEDPEAPWSQLRLGLDLKPRPESHRRTDQGLTLGRLLTQLLGPRVLWDLRDFHANLRGWGESGLWSSLPPSLRGFRPHRGLLPAAWLPAVLLLLQAYVLLSYDLLTPGALVPAPPPPADPPLQADAFRDQLVVQPDVAVAGVATPTAVMAAGSSRLRRLLQAWDRHQEQLSQSEAASSSIAAAATISAHAEAGVADDAVSAAAAVDHDPQPLRAPQPDEDGHGEHLQLLLSQALINPNIDSNDGGLPSQFPRQQKPQQQRNDRLLNLNGRASLLQLVALVLTVWVALDRLTAGAELLGAPGLGRQRLLVLLGALGLGARVLAGAVLLQSLGAAVMVSRGCLRWMMTMMMMIAGAVQTVSWILELLFAPRGSVSCPPPAWMGVPAHALSCWLLLLLLLLWFLWRAGWCFCHALANIASRLGHAVHGAACCSPTWRLPCQAGVLHSALGVRTSPSPLTRRFPPRAAAGCSSDAVGVAGG